MSNSSREAAASVPSSHERLWRALLDEVREVPERDFDGLPVLDPSTYRRRECRCGGCVVCKFFRSIEEDADDARRRRAAQIAGQNTRDLRHRFPHERAALHSYVTARAAGYQPGSSAGALLATAESGVHSPRSGPGESHVLRTADDVVEVERALEVAYDDGNDRDLGPRACRAILLARVVGRDVPRKTARGRLCRERKPVSLALVADRHGVSEAAVNAIVRSGLRRVRVELAARRLIPAPGGDSAVARQVQRRQAELEEKSHA